MLPITKRIEQIEKQQKAFRKTKQNTKKQHVTGDLIKKIGAIILLFLCEQKRIEQKIKRIEQKIKRNEQTTSTG